MKKKFIAAFAYSDKNYQVPNIDKTVYVDFSKNSSEEPIMISDKIVIKSVRKTKGYLYLGMIFLPTNEIFEIILKNINDRKGNISKYYAWLEINESTPIEVKLLVFDICFFSSILYGIEAWGDVSCITDMLLLIERKALKRILKVKSGTSTDLVYHELRRPDIISKIKDMQYNFFQRVCAIQTEDAIVKSIMDICKHTKILKYYHNLHNHNAKDNLAQREAKIQRAESTMMRSYAEKEFITKNVIYWSFMNDDERGIITRWRLSNHRLHVETGRYTIPKTPRENRSCLSCGILEDEHHAIFVCPMYSHIRLRYRSLLERNTSVMIMLNPSIDDAQPVARLLMDIEACRENLGI